MKNYFKSKSVVYIALLSLLSALLFIFHTTFFPYHFSIETQSQIDGKMQVFYSSHKYFEVNKSINVFVRKTDDYETHTITLKHKNIRGIRIDPPGDFNIKSIRLYNKFHSYKYEGDNLFGKIKPLNHIQSIRINDNQIEGIVNGEDPYFQITGLPLINQFSCIGYAIFLLGTFFFFYAIYSFLWNRYLKYDFHPIDRNRMTVNIYNSVFSILVISIFLWFAYQTYFYATHIAEWISPDENYHLQVSSFHSRSNTLFIQDSPETFGYGAISVRPYLFHFLMGKLLMLNVFNLSNLLYLRFVNILLSLFSLYVIFLLIKEITKNKWIQLAVLIMQTNILMYVFISSMISYDNLINLISVVSFLLLIRFLRTFSRLNLIMLLLTMLAGSLTKVTYLPIVLIQIIILTSYSKTINKNRQKIFYSSLSIKDSILIFSLIVLFILNLNLYGKNITTYGSIQPKTSKVFGHDKAYTFYPQYRREYDLKSTVNERTMMQFFEYLLKYANRTEKTIFGILGHKQIVKSTHGLFLYRFIILLSVFLFALNYKKVFTHLSMKIFMFSFVSYIIVILFYNYQSYQALRSFGLALQGRYNFPVIALVNIFVVYNLLVYFRDRTKIILLIVLTVLLVYNNYFWFLSNVTPEWYLN